MRRILHFSILLGLILLISSCNSEKKVVRYKGIYDEKPTYIFAPTTIDKSIHRDENVNNYSQKRRNIEYNKEIKKSCTYFYSSIFYPITKKGYYVIQEFSTQEILKKENITDSEQLMLLPTGYLNEKYGIDAILYTYILAWKDEDQGNWKVFLDYQLKSAYTDSLMFRTRVKGEKQIPFSLKGIVTLQSQDKARAKQLKIDDNNSLIQRVLLLTEINNFILANLPFGQFDKKYEQDQNKTALGDCVEYSIGEDGGLSIKNIPLEQFEQECFIF